MSADGWEQRLDDVGQARELREEIARAIAESRPWFEGWESLADAPRDGLRNEFRKTADAVMPLLAPLLAAQAAVERVEALSAEWASEHPRGCCASGTCAFTDGRHTDPSDPIRARELVGILSDNPPPVREHKTIPCPGDCCCQIGKYESRLRAALDGTP